MEIGDIYEVCDIEISQPSKSGKYVAIAADGSTQDIYWINKHKVFDRPVNGQTVVAWLKKK